MVASGAGTRLMQQASVVVAWSAAATACYLLVFDASSNWFDRLMGCGLGIFTLYMARSVFRRTTEELVPTWRAGGLFEAVAPFIFPLYLLWWSQDRGSRLAWLGWGLLAAAVVIQVAIWRLERSHGGVLRQETSARQR